MKFKYIRTSSYKEDYQNLSALEKQKTKLKSKDFVTAIETGDDTLRKQLNIHKLNGKRNPEIWGAHISGDLVFTFYYDVVNGEKAIVFLRIGTHSVYP